MSYHLQTHFQFNNFFLKNNPWNSCHLLSSNCKPNANLVDGLGDFMTTEVGAKEISYAKTFKKR